MFKINDRVMVKVNGKVEGPYKVLNKVEDEHGVRRYLLETLKENSWVPEEVMSDYVKGSRTQYKKTSGYKGKEVDLRKVFFFTE